MLGHRRSNRAALVPVERRTLKDGVYELLREALMTGEYQPGDRLTVRGVATRTGTSSMPVREAFRRLVSEGAIESLPNGSIQIPVLNLIRLRDLTDIRLELEGLAARRTAIRMSAEDLGELKHANEAVMAAMRAGDFVAEARANERFHFCVYRAAGSSDLFRLLEHLWLQIGPNLIALFQARERNHPAPKRGFYRHHKVLIAAIQDRDAAGAEAAITADIREGAIAIVSAMEEASKVRGPARRRRGSRRS